MSSKICQKARPLSLFFHSLFSLFLSKSEYIQKKYSKGDVNKPQSTNHNKKKLHFSFLLTSIILVTTQCFLFCFRKIKRNTKNESRKDPSVCLPLLIWVSLRLPLPPPQVLPLALLLPLAPPPVLHLLPPLLLWPIRFPPSKHS